MKKLIVNGDLRVMFETSEDIQGHIKFLEAVLLGMRDIGLDERVQNRRRTDDRGSADKQANVSGSGGVVH